MSIQQVPSQLMLASVSGPTQIRMPLESDEPITIGRRSSCSIVLDKLEVSKSHAQLARHPSAGAGEWTIVDLGSRHGTLLNGIRLQPNVPCPVRAGDLIQIAPWTFRLLDPCERPDASVQLVQTVDDNVTAAGSTVTSIQTRGSQELAHERLMLLLHCAESLQSAADQRAMAEIALDAALRGTGYSNGAITGPMTADASTTLLASRGDIQGGAGAVPRLSRSLMHAASPGVPVQMVGENSDFGDARSILRYGIQQALCVPLIIETVVAGYLYLDQRGSQRHAVAEDASAFAIGVGRLISMAWSNIVRRDLEKRMARIDGELQAAARAQQMILPARIGCFGDVAFIGECRPGRMISGDFFDVIPLQDGRVAVTIGDVVGKGVAASVMMTTTQGFVHAALRHHGDPARALSELNAYTAQRSDSQRFITIWAGVFDPRHATVTYCDGGHGYAWLFTPAGELVQLNRAGGAPIAISDETQYAAETTSWARGSHVLLVSDGIVEQWSRTSHRDSQHQFGTTMIQQMLRQHETQHDLVANIFSALFDHAGTQALADDATIVAVRWRD